MSRILRMHQRHGLEPVLCPFFFELLQVPCLHSGSSHDRSALVYRSRPFRYVLAGAFCLHTVVIWFSQITAIYWTPFIGEAQACHLGDVVFELWPGQISRIKRIHHTVGG